MGEIKLQTRTIGNALIVAYSSISEYEKSNLAEEAIGKILASPAPNVVLDMKNVTQFLSENITHLIRLYRTLDQQERKLYMVNMPEAVMKVLSMVNIIGRFTVLHSEAELQQTFGSGAHPGGGEEHLALLKRAEGLRHVISIEGAFVEGKNGDRLLEEIESSLMQDASEIVIDLTRSSHIDTVSTSVLLKIHDVCGARGVRLRAVGANAVVAHVLRANGVADLFGI